MKDAVGAPEAAVAEEAPAEARRKPLVSPVSLLHYFWLRKWVIALTWLAVALPVGVSLSLFDLPRTFSSRTILRFPEVVGAQTNMMRDVAINQTASIVSIFTSYQVLANTIERQRLRLRITTPDVFRSKTFTYARYGESLGEGEYALYFADPGHASLKFKPRGGATWYGLYDGPVREGKLEVPGLELGFTPAFLANARGFKVAMAFKGMDRTVEDLREALKVRDLGGVNCEVGLKDRDPWLVADILNTLREEFLKVYYGTTDVQDMGVLAQMEKDLDESKRRLEKSQDELSAFYAAHPELVQQPDQRNPGDNLAYLEAKGQRDQVANLRQRLQRAMDAKPEGGEEMAFWANEILGTMSEAGDAKAPILRGLLFSLGKRETELRASLGPGHPKLQQLGRERDSLYEQIDAAFADLNRALARKDQDLQTRATGLAPTSAPRPSVKSQLELDRLSQANKNAEDIYSKLLASYNRAKLTTGSEFFKVTVVDEARPALYEPPSFKGRLLVAALAMFLLLALVPGGFLLSQAAFPKIWTRSDVRQYLDAKVLGLLLQRQVPPAPPAPAEAAPGQLEPSDPLLLFQGSAHHLEDIEAFRLIREQCERWFRNGRRPGKLTLMVTSSRPGEGKSICAANLAMVFARKGRRTLLIDADFRLGRTARIFGLKPERGLDDVLQDAGPKEQEFMEAAAKVFLPSTQKDLVLVPRRAFRANAAELIGSARFRAFLRTVQSEVDVVILDCPPVGVTPEPLSLADLVDGALFLCRSGLTGMREARESLEYLRERDMRVGVILNGLRTTPFEQNRYTKYSGYYRAQA